MVIMLKTLHGAESVSICPQIQPVCGLIFGAKFAVNAVFILGISVNYGGDGYAL